MGEWVVVVMEGAEVRGLRQARRNFEWGTMPEWCSHGEGRGRVYGDAMRFPAYWAPDPAPQGLQTLTTDCYAKIIDFGLRGKPILAQKRLTVAAIEPLDLS